MSSVLYVDEAGYGSNRKIALAELLSLAVK